MRSLLIILTMALPFYATAQTEPSTTLIEMRRHMLDADINSLTFRSMDQMFHTLEVKTAGSPALLEERPAMLDFSYEFDGETIPAAAFADRTYTNALLIIRDNHILHESYYNNTGPDSRFLSMSMAKSVTSLLVGMALADGTITSVDDQITMYVPELEGTGYDGVTIRQALLMRSGADWDERYDFDRETPMSRLHNASVVENRIRFVTPALMIGRAHPPGEVFNYSTVETAVLGLVLERATGKPLNEYMSERWWQRAGMRSNGFWLADGPPGVGRALNGMGFNATLRDYARIGLMVLHEGNANGRQLVPPEWIIESTRPEGTEPVSPERRNRGYQYQWWTLTDSDAFMAVGLQGQFLYIDPGTNTVVVKLSYFPPGEVRADVETEAFLRAVSQWQPQVEVDETAVQSQVTHPLDALTADEIRHTKEILLEANRINASAQFAALTLKETDKETVRAWRGGQPLKRSVFAVILQDGRAYEADIDLDAGTVTRWAELDGMQPRVLISEIDGVNDYLWANADWRSAMQNRGFDESLPMFCAPLAPGPVLPVEFAGRRLLYLNCFEIEESLGNLFARPIEGLMAIYDVSAKSVLRVVDLGNVPMSTDDASLFYNASPQQRPQPNPVTIETPEGSNIVIENSLVHWDNWEFHLRVDQRVGPVLSQVRYHDQGTPRDIIYQLSVSEMFVPYMDPSPTWSWRAYMDVGEYGFGLLSSPLTPGSDCPASAHYLDHTLADDSGQPIIMKNIACIFERPSGDPIWRHVGDGVNESRPKVELVVRMAPVVGNYDYIIDYIFDQAGDIVVRAGAAGIDAVKGVAAQTLADLSAADETKYGTLIAPGLVGPNHEHHIIFRLDMDVDGTENRAVFDEFAIRGLPGDNPRRSLWTVAKNNVSSEGPLPFKLHEGFLRIESTSVKNIMGYPSSYLLHPGYTLPSLLSEDDPIQVRAAWSSQPVWLSRYHPDEIYASGPYPNANPKMDGLTKWVQAKRDINGKDLVLWYNIGFRHITRAEDWPTMPTVWHSFRLRPVNFFNRNPALIHELQFDKNLISKEKSFESVDY